MRWPRAFFLLCCGLGLAACTSDGFDPAGWVSGPAELPQQIPMTGYDSDPDFPSLDSVPPRPRPSPQVMRLKRVEGLALDHATAAYNATPQDNPVPKALAPAEAGPAAPSLVRPPAPKISREPQVPGPAPLPPLPAAEPLQAGATEPLSPRAPPTAAPLGPGSAAPGPGSGAKAVSGELVAMFYFPALVGDVAPTDRPLLKELALLQQQRRGRLRIVGHAAEEARMVSSGGRMMADLEISQARAAAVASALLKLGVPSESVTVAAAGHAQPRHDPTTPAGVAANRRVEVFLE